MNAWFYPPLDVLIRFDGAIVVARIKAGVASGFVTSRIIAV
jgi:hypothetical protein